MKGDRIIYKQGYKYHLQQTYTIHIGIHPPCTLKTPWLRLTPKGWLTILIGYAWDGPSGPTLDTPSSMRGSLVHDALYQLMRLGVLSEAYRAIADRLLHDICIEDGMHPVRADLWHAMVQEFAAGYARYGTEPPVLTAPPIEEGI